MKREQYSAGFHPIRFVFGYKIIGVTREAVGNLLNLCQKEGISYRDVALLEEGARLCVPFLSSFKLARAAKKAGIELFEVKNCGIPALVLKYKARIGIPIGFLLAVLMIFFSQTVVWDIRIDGEEALSEEYVEQVLSECGLSVGMRKKSLDIDAIENRTLIEAEGISWISVNIIGSVAKVEIRELAVFDDEEDDGLTGAVDVVAERGGVIVGFDEVHGNIVTAVGDSVSEGQVLISGVFGDEVEGYRFVSADGKVFAEVDKSFSVSVPRKYQKKVYTGEVKYEKYLIFFEKEIKFFSNSRNLYPLYDKIDTEEYLRAPSGDRLPFGVRTVRYMEYEYVEAERSDAELMRIAEYKMNLTIVKESSELLRKNTSFELSDEGYTLVCDVKTVENIAKRQRVQTELYEKKEQ